ncbi:iron-sulfur cluster insertion protein ErpA [uncultured Psychrobacter sp.]|uniref:iron-sulfur cluster insertion protein ErpA n=1 Tax=unclassified Psychrobacter TaxID=196806 RepID=UPI00293D83B2|nr:iron-sulfur cluster insertion protein ErpA [uncultured Psychrobacter sp.]
MNESATPYNPSSSSPSASWPVDPTILTLTDSAAQKVRRLREEEGDNELMLRVYVTGGGCSGFSYGFRFDSDLNEDDANFDNEDVTLVIDSMSYQYLQGSTVDYIEGLEGARFVVQNPNATTTCGCGSSFSI